jgi:hypothetical protein
MPWATSELHANNGLFPLDRRGEFFRGNAKNFALPAAVSRRKTPKSALFNAAQPLLNRRPMTDTLQARVRSEYREMPGLRLTAAQAARLFNLEPAHCAKLLEALVADGALWTNGREYFDANVGRRFA